MNNFEKRKFLDYLEKLLPVTDTNTYSFDTVFDFMLSEFKIDITKISVRNKDGELMLNDRKSRGKFSKEMKKIIKTLKTTIKPRATRLEQQLLMIKEIFLLTEHEYEIFIYLILKEVNNIFDKYYESLEGNSFTTFCKNYLGLRYGKKERIMEALYLKNIIASKRNDSINEVFLKIFDNPKINTADKIIAGLMGKKLKTSLHLKDYEHIKETEKVINILTKAIEQKRKGVNILLYGGVGTGKTEYSKLIAQQAGCPIFEVITEKDKYKEADREDRLVDLYSKQLLLAKSGNACILFDEAEDVMNNMGCFASKGYMNKLLESTSVPIIWTSNNIYNVDPAILRRMTYCIEFEKLTEDARLNIWNRVLKKNKLKISSEKVVEFNKKYDIPPSIISNAIQTTKMINGDENDFEGFVENVAKVVNKKKNVKNKKEFLMNEYDESLVNTDIDIKLLTQKIKSSEKLNFSLCLYGEPGTGKSLYARFLAKQIGCDVLLKRASDLISKWVGETEQNIAAAFAEARDKKAMLIFDEADSFLQNRQNASRNWEVSQVNEMLTWMESHEYPFVCTTNLLNSLDEASLRRFTFKIKFDFLSPEQVNYGLEHFFAIQDANCNLKGVTAGDFATVKKKVDFLGIEDAKEIISMLKDEVKIKKSKDLQNTIGF